MIEIQSDTGTWYQRWGVRALSLGGQVMKDGVVKRGKGVGEAETKACLWGELKGRGTGESGGPGVGVLEVSTAAI